MPPILKTHQTATGQLINSLQQSHKIMSRRQPGGKQQSLDRCFQNLSISSRQMHAKTPQHQKYDPKKPPSQRTYSTDGRTYSEKSWPRSDHNHRDHRNHEPSQRGNHPYQCREDGPPSAGRQYPPSDSRGYSSTRLNAWVQGIPHKRGAMPFNPGPPSRAGDEGGDSGGSEVSAETVIPPDHQRHTDSNHRRMRQSPRAPSVLTSIRRRHRTKRDPSVAPSGVASAGNAPLSHQGDDEGRSEWDDSDSDWVTTVSSSGSDNTAFEPPDPYALQMEWYDYVKHAYETGVVDGQDYEFRHPSPVEEPGREEILEAKMLYAKRRRALDSGDHLHLHGVEAWRTLEGGNGEFAKLCQNLG